MKTNRLTRLFTTTLGLVAIALSACNDSEQASPEVPEEVGYDPSSILESWENKSFESFGQIIDKVAKQSEFTLYEGLPHQLSQKKQLTHELKTKSTVKRYGFDFYTTPLEMSEKDATKLTALLSDPKSFNEFQPKWCGIFHPDFSVVYGKGKEATEIHLCLGCYEVLAFHKDIAVHCDLTEEVDDKFKALLTKYNKQRPKSEWDE